ncbi:MAG: thiamine biosynthesis protein ThiC, partial [Alphaproteobacteria bacterium]
GHDWCSLRISKEIAEFASGKDASFQPERRACRSPGVSPDGAELVARRAVVAPVVDGRHACHSEVTPEETDARNLQGTPTAA